MFQKKTSGEARVGARDGYNRIVSPHVRLFPHNNSKNTSYSLDRVDKSENWKIKFWNAFFIVFLCVDSEEKNLKK